MIYPSGNDWLFSLKTFAAAMLALYIALAVPLPRPYWAMASVYIVSNPFVGATRSKALYRVLGTAVGAAVAVLLVPPFVESPYLFSFIVATWTGAMVYLALLDRTARAYVFLLAGYTLPLVALPTVTDPTTIFDVAVARTEEIAVGIICASVVGSIVFPSKLAPSIIARTDAWFADAARFASDLLTGRMKADATLPRQQQLSATVKALEALLGQLSYDHASPDVVARAYALRERMQLFLPVLSALPDPLGALRRADAPDVPQFESLLTDVVHWFQAPLPGIRSPLGTDAGAASLRAKIASLRLTATRNLGTWDGALLANALVRLQQLVDIWQDCRSLRVLIERHDGSWRPQFNHWRINSTETYADRGLLLLSAMSTVGFIVIACSVWIASGWNDGASAVFVAAVACCFFAGLDEPAPAILRFFIATCIAVVGSGVYLFALLPYAHNFEMLVLMFAAPFIAVGTLIALPKFNLIAMLVALFTATFISLRSAYDANFMLFINSNLATLAGLFSAFVWVRVTRPFGVEIAAQRLLRSTWADVALSASTEPIDDERTFFSRMLDRLTQLTPRLAITGPHHHPSIERFSDLRVASNSLDLRRYRNDAAADVSSAIDQVLENVHAYYEHCVAERARQPVPRVLIDAIDAAVERIAPGGPTADNQRAPRSLSAQLRLRDALHALVSLRLSLAPGPFPAPSAPVAEPAA
ncbi:MAG TPA: FUSC family protein [Paraburkholderia sp.]|jgi:uncharacterized membrane protein YccC